MKIDKKLLSFFLAVLMVFSTFGDTVYALSSSNETGNRSVGTEIKGKVIGDKEVFSFTIPKKSQRQSAQAYSFRRANRMMTPPKAPAGTTDTTVVVTAKGLGTNPFDWSALPSSEFKITVEWETTDGQKHEKDLTPAITAEGTFYYNVGWPTDGTLKGTATLVTSFNQNIEVRVIDVSSTSTPDGQAGLKFTIDLKELAEPRADVKYVDPYGRELTDAADLPSASDTMPNVTADELTGGVAIALPKTSDQINMRDSEDIDEDELHAAASGLTYKVGGQGDEGTVKIGGKDYKLDISQPNAKEVATILLAYQKDVVIPPTKPGTNEPVDVADGYTRITFDPTDKAIDKAKTYYDVKNTLTWAQATANTIKPHVAEPSDPIPKDATKNFVAWLDGKAKLADKTGTVAETTFTAKYSDDVVPQKPGEDKPSVPSNFVKVDFSAGEHGTFEKVEGKDQTTIYWVNPTKEVTVPAPTVTANDGWKQKTGAAAWDKPLKATFAQATKITAQYEAKPVVIIPDNQDDPGTTPEGYVRVTFAPGTDGKFGTTDKKVFDVLKGKTIQDAQAADPKLVIPTVTANEGKTYEGWTDGTTKVEGKDKVFAKDLKDYTTALNADVNFTAKYTDKKVVIIPDDQDNPGTTPEGYVRVTFAPGTDGKFGTTDKKVFDVLKGKTIQDAQAADPKLVIPTVTANEGKTYEGWTDGTTKVEGKDKVFAKDLKDYTTALNADVNFTAKYTDNGPTTSNADDYDPYYTGKSGKPGETVQIDAPTFTKKGVTGNVPAPNGTKFANNDPNQTNVTVDPNTGAITVAIPQDAPVGSTITIAVDVTYPDRSNETVEVTVTVSDNTQPKPEEDKSKTPIVDPVNDGDTSISGKGEPGSDIIINVPGKDPIKTTVDDGGKWIAPIDPAHEGDVIKVVQIEVGKKPSDPSYVTVGGRSIIVPSHDDGGYWWFGGGSFKPVETEEQVIDKTEHGIHIAYIFGYKDHTFRCEGKITRAEAASMIAHIAKLDLSDNSKPDFKDTPSSWYNAAINAMVKKNLMFADKNGNFRPNEPITRGEFARAIQFIDKVNKKEAPFMDIKGHEFEEAINQAYANGRIAGYPDGTFKPDESITRAEAVTILNNFDGRMVRERGIEDVKKDLIKFTDLKPSHWAYYEIIEASNSHAYSRISNDSKEEKWSNLIK